MKVTRFVEAAYNIVESLDAAVRYDWNYISKMITYALKRFPVAWPWLSKLRAGKKRRGRERDRDTVRDIKVMRNNQDLYGVLSPLEFSRE